MNFLTSKLSLTISFCRYKLLKTGSIQFGGKASQLPVVFLINRAMSKRSQPEWFPPENPNKPQLKLYNSLTRSKEVFVPQNGNLVTWYNCGPTVYDASHMGHARNYLTFDILKRVLQNYFGYDIFYVMNITDIDDKIIKRARQNHLYEQYRNEGHGLAKVLSDCNSVILNFKEVLENTTDPDKRSMQQRLFEKLSSAVQNVAEKVKENDPTKLDQAKNELLEEAKDLLSDWLDKHHGAKVTDNSIFAKLPQYWEEMFHRDMENLNILPADCLTRVSEYIPENVKFIERIIEQGYAYESNGSVYFNVAKFDAAKHHHYAKLVPEAFGDKKALEEGEGDLSVGEEKQMEKQAENDFALWKASKAGEPSWDSPWGKGRPGWHIECSAMASSILGDSIDIHTGGYDLKFPHHDNELAQSEAAFDNNNWIRYFLHSGHLTISGCKMSKSLKNFITIQDALKTHTARQLRLVFLLHSWKDTLDYSGNTMELAKSYERTMNEFFLGVKHILRTTPSRGVAAFQKWDDSEVQLNKKFLQSKADVHEAFCDNIDTRSVLESLKELVYKSNIYIKENESIERPVNRQLLKTIVSFITGIFDILGVSGRQENIGFPSSGDQSSNLEDIIMPYVNAIATFRDTVRQEARILKATNILVECDKLRDDVLPDLGIRLEDKGTGPPVIKLMDKAELLAERERAKEMEQKKLEEAQRKKVEMEAKQAALDAIRKIPPSEMFRSETDKYSKFDDKGIPTHDAKGEEISKAQMKKLQKLYQVQEKKYNDYLASTKPAS